MTHNQPSRYITSHERVREALRQVWRTPEELPDSGPYVLTYYLPLLERSSIPAGFMSVRFIGDLPAGFDARNAANFWPIGAPLPPESNFLQLLFRTIEVPFSLSYPNLLAAEVAAGLASDSNEPLGENESPPVEWTVIEATTLIPDPALSDDWNPDTALEHLLGFVRDLQVNSLLAGGQPTTLLEFATLPPILVARKRRPTEGRVTGTVFGLITGTSLHRQLPPPELTPAQAERFLATAHAYDEPSLLTDVQVLLGQATLALDDRAEARTSLINCDTAAQVALDSLLISALWEEGFTPESAGRLFEANGLLTRVRKQYSQRFGGNWQLTGGSKIARWHVHISIPRHRAVHLAEQVPPRTAAHAIATCYELLDFVDERLADGAVRRRYPKTASLVTRFGHSRVTTRSDAEVRSDWIELTQWREAMYNNLTLFRM
jgi:hypothetical protein